MGATHAGLVDREREVATIQELLDRTEAGSGSSLAVYGGIGSGKTALLAAAVAHARKRQFTVLQVRGDYADRDRPFALAARLFGPLRNDPDQHLGSPDPEPAGATFDGEASALHRALARRATGGPVLISFDDVHWADRESLNWLTVLQQRLERLRVTLVVSVCGGETWVDPTLLDELLAGATHELHPGCLGLTATTTVLTRALDDDLEPSFVAACVAATGGNPLLVTSLAAAVAARRVEPTATALADLSTVDLPRLGPALKFRLRRLSPDALPFTGAVAVLGEDATIDRVSDITSIDVPVATELALALSRLGVVRAIGTRLDFTVPVLRDVVLRVVPFASLHSVKTQAARLLRAAAAPAENVAEQLLVTPPLAEPWVPDILRRAAREALLAGSAATAATYLQRALREPVPAGVQTELLRELGAAEAHVDVRSAIGHLTTAVHRGADPAVRGTLAELLAMTGERDRAIELLRQAPDGASDDTTRLLELQLEHADMAGLALTDLAAASRAPTCADPRLLSLLALREVWQGTSRAAAIAYAEQALALAADDLGHSAATVRAVLALTAAGRPEDAYGRCTALVDAAARQGHQPALAAARSARAAIGRELGRLVSALQDARAGLELILGCGVDRRRGVAVEILARLIDVLVDTGRYEEAEDLLEVGQLTGGVEVSWAGTAVLLARGRLRIAAGRPAEGAQDLRTADAQLEAWQITNPAAAPWRAELALALHELGQHAEARSQLGDDVARARAWNSPAPLALALRAAAVTGGPSSRATLEEAITLLEGSPANLARTRCLIAYGTALRQARQPRAARMVLHEALEAAEKCQSPPLVEQAGAQLTAAGGRRSRRCRDGVAALTPAERRVVALAARGRTNRAIAEQLFVRLRTVEIHLTNAYRKLGIAGRDQLAQKIRRGPAQSEPVAG